MDTASSAIAGRISTLAITGKQRLTNLLEARSCQFDGAGAESPLAHQRPQRVRRRLEQPLLLWASHHQAAGGHLLTDVAAAVAVDTPAGGAVSLGPAVVVEPVRYDATLNGSPVSISDLSEERIAFQPEATSR